MGGFAWVTLATNDSYSLGSLVLAHSLKQVGTAHQLVVLVTPGVTDAMKEKLAQVFNVVQEVNILDSRDEGNLRLLRRPELGITFTKLHCWRLTQFEKCVFLDADTLVLQNCDELFERDEFSAAPDVGWPDCFNSGVFVYRPSLDTFEKLIKFALEKGSFDGGDQGLLNLYFSDWAHKDISKHLPFIYNMCSTACYSYLPAFKQFGADAKIIHFIGAQKPWLAYFNTETRKVQPSSDSSHLQEVLQRWWDIFCSLIHPVLSPAMQGQSQHEVSHSHFPPQFNPPLNPTPSADDYENAYDPWDDYDRKLAHNTHIITDHSQVTLNTNTSRVADQSQPHLDTHYHQVQSLRPQSVQHEILRDHSPLPVQHHFHPPEIHSKPHYQEFHDNQSTHYVHDNVPQNPHVPENISQQNHPHEEHHVEDVVHEQHIEISTYHVHPEHNFQNPVVPERPPSPTSPPIYTPILPKECEATTNVSNEITLTSTIEDSSEGDAGLAGAFSQLTLGVARTAEQDAVENVLRKQAWEVGNIDYLGRDSFDNIWSKIVQTISSAPDESTLQPTNDSAPANSQSPSAPQHEAGIDQTSSIEYSLDKVKVQSGTSVEVPTEPVLTISEIPQKTIKEPCVKMIPEKQEQTGPSLAPDKKLEAVKATEQMETSKEKSPVQPSSVLKESEKEIKDPTAAEVPMELASPVIPICSAPSQAKAEEQKSEFILENVGCSKASEQIAEPAKVEESSAEVAVSPKQTGKETGKEAESADLLKKSSFELAVCTLSTEEDTKDGKSEEAQEKLLEGPAAVPPAIPAVFPMPPRTPEQEMPIVESGKLADAPKVCLAEPAICPIPIKKHEIDVSPKSVTKQVDVPTESIIEPIVCPMPFEKISVPDPVPEPLKEEVSFEESSAKAQQEKTDNSTQKVTAPIQIDAPKSKETVKGKTVLAILPAESTQVPDKSESVCRPPSIDKTETAVDNASCPLPLDSQKSEMLQKQPEINPQEVTEGTKATELKTVEAAVPAETQKKEAAPPIEQMKQALKVDTKIPETPPPKESVGAFMATPTPPPRKTEKQKKASGKSKK